MCPGSPDLVAPRRPVPSDLLLWLRTVWSGRLRREAVIVVQAVEDRTRDELAFGRLGRGQFGVRVGDAVDALMLLFDSSSTHGSAFGRTSGGRGEY